MTSFSVWQSAAATKEIELREAARAELDAREKARESLIEFTKYTFARYTAELAHVLMAEHLEQVVRGEIKKLMIFAPPQHGKSELVSVRLPAFWLAKRPGDPVIITSYGAGLAEDKSGQARAVIESSDFNNLFPNVKLRYDTRSKAAWRLANDRGGIVAAGVGGPITGHGAALGIIDDPHKDWAETQSALQRQKVWDWYRGTFRTRVWEHGAIVLIMTRWHEDDLAGRLLADQPGDWIVLRLPALAETQDERDKSADLVGLPAGARDPLGRRAGQALCPQRYSRGALLSIKKEVGSLVWYAEYQGTPRAPEGNRIKRAWFEIVGSAPRCKRYARYWDKAGTESETSGGAATAGVLMGVDDEGVYYVIDVVGGHWGALDREREMRQTAELDRDMYGRVMTYTEQEPGSGGKESAQATIRNMAGFRIQADKVTGSKEIRAEPFIAQAEGRNVKLVRGAWNKPYLDELAAFPNGARKDQVDATSGAFNKIAERRPAKVRAINI